MPRSVVLIIYMAVAALVAAACFKYVLPILVPFIIAFIFSLLMERVIVFLQLKAKMSRGLAVMTTMIAVFGVLTVVFSVLVLQLVAELIKLSDSLPVLADTLKLYFQDLIERGRVLYSTLPPGVISSLEQNITNLASNLQGLASKAANSLLLFVSMVPGTITVAIVSILATYFLARDRQLIANLILRLIPAPWDEKAATVTREVATAFAAYLRAQAILMFITIILSVSGLYLIGADYALTIGLLVGFFELIPVLGPATIYLPLIIWSFATGSSTFGIKITVLYALVLMVRQVLETKIISANLGLHPLATLVAMYAGLKTFGLAGLIMGPILLIAIQAMIKAGVWFHRYK